MDAGRLDGHARPGRCSVCRKQRPLTWAGRPTQPPLHRIPFDNLADELARSERVCDVCLKAIVRHAAKEAQ